MKRHFLKFAALAVIGSVVSACGGSDDHDSQPAGTIVQVAEAGGLSYLLAAATKAELADELSAASTAGLTVFAPTNAAFNTLATQLGLADGPALVAALPKEALASILSYHVLPARKSAADLSSGVATQATIYSFEGSAATVRINTTAGVSIGDAVLTEARVTTANVAATNGVVHIVDKVLVPPGVLNVVQMAQANPAAFSTLVGAVASAGLVPTLSSTTDPLARFTVFTPTNAAFEAIASTVAGLTPTQLSTVLTYHVLDSQVLSTAIPFGTPVTTVAGQDITINAGTAPVIATITDTTATPATITVVDVRASNGVIHVIDKVLIPSLTAPT